MVWKGKLDILSMPAEPDADKLSDAQSNVALATAGRELEIFLDMMASYATDNHSYLLAPAYDAGMNHAEAKLRTQLLKFAEQPRPPGTEEVWALLDETLERLGHSGSNKERES
jgi:hypothetical protein